jgi:hypothetical protein
MARGGKRKGKPRNPFAGRPRSGAGPHSSRKYGKQDRRKARKEMEENKENGG